MTEARIAVIGNDGNRARIDRLKAAGVPLFEMELEPFESAGKAVDVANSIDEIDWLVFADLRAADIFLTDLEAEGIDPFALDEVSIFASGEAVADRLRFSQVHSDVIPRKLAVTSQSAEIGSYCGSDGIAGSEFSVLFSGDVCAFPSESLRGMGAGVCETRMDLASPRTSDAKALALLKGGAFERFHFFSVYDVYDLAAIVNPQEVSEIVQSAEVTASDAATVRALMERDVLARLSQLTS